MSQFPRLAFWIGLLFLVLPLASAQEGTPAPGSSLIIHVVQRDETLSQIAQQYGTDLDTLITANSLLDPNSLSVGQSLIIPNRNSGISGMVMVHQVEPGETLETIAARYNSTLESLAEVNHISHTDTLYIGQEIQVAVGANGLLPPETVSLHVVQPDDYLLKIAAKYNISINTLAELNHLNVRTPLQVGQRLMIPGTYAAGRFVELPAMLADFQLDPLPIVQGHSVHLVITTRQPEITISGDFMDKPISFTQDGTEHHAMLGIHAFTEPGIYPMLLQITAADGTQTAYEVRLNITDGGYGREVIDIPPERQGLLAPEIVQAELDRITQVMSGFTSQHYFDGLMSLPSTGPVTSQFGTRRSYNGSEYNTFHGGTDFGGALGSSITAPAGGIVVVAELLNVRGNTVIIDHGLGVYTGYWHQSEFYVQVGQQVNRGDLIGTLGETGLVTGAHLHWEMWVGGVQVDPMQWLSHPFVASSLPEE